MIQIAPQSRRWSSPSKEREGDPISNIRVVGRIRPVEESSKKVIRALDDSVLQVDALSLHRWFELDACLDDNSTQEDVYIQSGAQQAVSEDIFKGFNCTIMAYGQTSSGKTHTVDGIIPRACSDVFDGIQKYSDAQAQVELSFVEIYQEELRDLMSSSESNRHLALRETMAGEVYVSGLEAKKVSSLSEITAHVKRASTRRTVGSTRMNSSSSRSHALCILKVTGVTENGNKFESKLTFVDLAGSEKLSKTGAQGKRMKEGININQGLFVLGQVIFALSDSRKKHKRKPPYRESKLTRLLQDSIGGNARTIMIACVSGADNNVEETINTLRYATMARAIKNSATRNVIKNISQEEAIKLERYNQLLQRQVQQLEKTIQNMLETSESSSVPSMVQSNDTPSTAEITTDDDFVDDDASHIADLENTIEKLKIKLSKATRTAKQQTKAEVVSSTNLQFHVQALEEELLDTKEVKEENESMYKRLVHLKAEAESSRVAATKLYHALEEMKNEQQLDKVQTSKIRQFVKEGNSWSIFIIILMCFQLFVTSVGYHHHTQSTSGQAAILEAVGNIPNSCDCPYV